MPPYGVCTRIRRPVTEGVISAPMWVGTHVGVVWTVVMVVL